jgi:8-oxo-dGTP diphosphatase
MPEQLPQIAVAAGVLMDANERVLIAQRPPGKHMAGYWEFPGGKISYGETAIAALVRELQEELGVQTRYARHLLCFEHIYPERMVQLHVWKVLSWDGEPHGCEGQSLRWLKVDELDQADLLPADELIIESLSKSSAVNTLAWSDLAAAVKV